MSKRALIVGINNFVRPSWRLRGCINDTIEMQGLLKTYFGFQGEDIKVLHDRDASAQGIHDGLAWLLSEYEGCGNDVRVFHFSSHGTQVDDQDGDEWECLDEVIVPYDHDWDVPFRDDDLRKIFDDIPEDVNFTFIADCCHSGSIQKLPPQIEFYPRYLIPTVDVADRIQELRDERDKAQNAYVSEHLAEMLKEVPPEKWQEKIKEFIELLQQRFRKEHYGVVRAEQHVLLAACEDRQTAADARIEGDFRGAFTWALSRAIKDANGDLTYDQLITGAGSNLQNFDQRPQLECPSDWRKFKIFAPLT